MRMLLRPSRVSPMGEPVHAPLMTQNPSWKPTERTFIWLARIPRPTLMSCLPLIMSNESEMENTLVPPWKGVKPRSPRPQNPPLGEIETRPQLLPKHLLPESQLMFAPGIPSCCEMQLLV